MKCWRRLSAAWVVGFGMAVWVPTATAQNADRGAGLYLQLPTVASCVSCHGPDVLANRNSFLRAADNPLALQKALNGVGVMGYLKSVLADADVADLSAFLGRVAPLANPDSTLQVWPLTMDFGAVGFGATAGPQRTTLRNRGSATMALQAPQLRGEGFAMSHDCPASLASGAACNIEVHTQPLAVGAATGVVEIASGATQRPVLVALAQRSVAPARAVLQWHTALDGLRFDVTNVGGAATLRVLLVNGGASDAVLGTVTTIGPQSASFAINGCAVGTVLPPSATCELSVTYTRTSEAAAAATLQLRSDGTNPPSLALTAAAIAAPPPVSPPGPPPPSAQTGGGVTGVFALTALALAAVGLRWRAT
jgi:cytochrome c553